MHHICKYARHIPAEPSCALYPLPARPNAHAERLVSRRQAHQCKKPLRQRNHAGQGQSHMQSYAVRSYSSYAMMRPPHLVPPAGGALMRGSVTWKHVPS